MAIRISAVICTLNRRALLQGAVKSLIGQTLPTPAYEIIVVDNGSTDGSGGAIESLVGTVPNLRSVDEPHRGLSAARNRGIREAHGDVVAFLDDDAQAARDWLERLRAVYDADPHVGAVGGRVVLRWPSRRPAWLPSDMEHQFSGKDEGAERRVLKFPSFFFGTNMSIRRDLLIRSGGFSPGLGRKGTGLIGDEERELFARLDQQGVKMVYEPAAVVLHHVLPERISPWWLLRRTFAAGRSSVLFDQHVRPRSRTYWFLEALVGVARVGRDGLLAVWAGLGRRRAEHALIYATRASRALGRTRQGLTAVLSGTRAEKVVR